MKNKKLLQGGVLRRRRPWQRATVRPLGREVMVIDELPLAQICIYPSCVILTRRSSTGAWRSYPVDADALTSALAKLPASTGMLPAGTIGTGLHLGKPFFVQFIAPRVVRLLVVDVAGPRVCDIQTPPLIWAGWEREYRIWAVPISGALSPSVALCHAPFPNVYNQGGICWGSVKVALAAPGTMGPMLKTFLEESVFNTHLSGGKSRAYNNNIIGRYAELSAETPYPVDDLQPAHRTLHQVLSGAVWAGGL